MGSFNDWQELTRRNQLPVLFNSNQALVALYLMAMRRNNRLRTRHNILVKHGATHARQPTKLLLAMLLQLNECLGAH